MWRDDLKQLSETKKYLTDSDIEELCDKYPDDAKEIWKFVYELMASERCKGCKHIGLYDKFYPCNCCTRRDYLQDFYEE